MERPKRGRGKERDLREAEVEEVERPKRGRGRRAERPKRGRGRRSGET